MMVGEAERGIKIRRHVSMEKERQLLCVCVYVSVYVSVRVLMCVHIV